MPSLLVPALVLCLLGPAAARTAWIVESPEFAADVRAHLTSSWTLERCGASGDGCKASAADDVRAVIGRADAVDLMALPDLELVQGVSYFYTDFAAVPSRAAVAHSTGFWPAQGVEQIAEWCIAAIFQHQYRMAAVGAAFRACAFSEDAPSGCAAASTATNHTMVSDLVVGVLGYGRIGASVAARAAALGATVVATKRHGPFTPPPAPLKWLSADNDRLYREADVVVVTVPGSGHPETAGLINRTSIGLMKEGALIVPVSAGPLDFGDLEAALRARPRLHAVVDTWPSGCWHYPNATCGSPPGPRCWPGPPGLAALPNVLPLPGVSMRDAAFWRSTAAFVARNLDALAAGRALEGVVRNASSGGLVDG